MVAYNVRLIFTFFYPYVKEKVWFGDQISKIRILMDLHVLRSPKSKTRILSGFCLCVWERMCMHVCACYQHNSKTNNSRNFKLVIRVSIKCRSYLQLFPKIEKVVCKPKQTKGSEYQSACRWNFLLVQFSIFIHFI